MGFCLNKKSSGLSVRTFLAASCFLPAAIINVPASAQIGSEIFSQFQEFDVDHRPQPLIDLQTLPRERMPVETIKDGETEGLPFDIREEAMKGAAISYGARGGLAWRTFEIRQKLDRRSSYMDRVFDFSQLLIAAPSGLLIEPPIVSESQQAMFIDTSGMEAAVSDRIYNIIMNARIVSAPRTWRNYLERVWDPVEPPPDVLRPVDEEERALWIQKVKEGWYLGIQQAEEIFQEDLNLLLADFEGMIRYRRLLMRGMISPPYALQVDRGITGDSNEMRIGDRAVQLTGIPELITGSGQWKPASR